MKQMAKLPQKAKFELLTEILNDPERKNLLQIFSDLIILTFYHKCIPWHYFSRFLFKNGANNIKDYFPDNFLYYKLKPFYNESAVRDVVENKLYFDFFYRQFGISLPKVLMFNYRKMFVRGSKYFEVTNSSEFKKQLQEIFRENPSYDSLIIKRTYGSYGGDQVFKVYKDQLDSDAELIKNLYNITIKSGFLVQETVKQHPELDVLNPSCLNTIRFDTFIDKDGRIEIISAYIRMSINNKHVDNISSGGCKVGIWLPTGKLKKYGYPSLSTNGPKLLKKHPITKTVFEDFTIPCFAEAKEHILRAAAAMPGLRLVGWDMAIGENGPVLIEGNSDYNMIGNDLSEGGYRTNAVFLKMLREAKLM